MDWRLLVRVAAVEPITVEGEWERHCSPRWSAYSEVRPAAAGAFWCVSGDLSWPPDRISDCRGLPASG